MRRILVFAVLVCAVSLVPVSGTFARDQANPPVAGNGDYSWSGTIYADAGQAGCPPITVTVNGNVNSGAVTLGVGSMNAGTSTHQSTSSTTYVDAGGNSHQSATATITNPPGMSVNEAAGSATGICTAMQTAKGNAGTQQGDSGHTDGDASYTLRFDKGQPPCDYTLTVKVHYPGTGGTPTVTVADGS